MPTNLPPEYFEAERRYKEASTPREKIERLEELIGTIPKHKGTDKLRADLRRRLSKLRESAQKSRKTGGHESAYHVEREGASRAVIIGPPNVGKSSLLNALTNANSPVSPAPFTTWTPAPGMMTWEAVQIQLLDTPPLNRDHMESELFDLIRSADLILLMLNLQADAFKQLHDSLEILQKHHVPLRRCKKNETLPDESDYLPLLVVVNKNDDPGFDEDFQVFKTLLDENCPLISISALNGRYLDELKKEIFHRLNLIRVFSKPPGREADLGTPFVLRNGSTLEDFAGHVHKDFMKNLKSARVWGKGVFDGQMVGRDYVLQDGDVVELHM
jgi:small GTP-binding protein